MDSLTRRALAGALLTPALRMRGQSCAPPPPPGRPTAFRPVRPGTTTPFRKSASALTPAEVTRLRLGYQRMRDLSVSDPNDPRGFQQQANIHCQLCGGGGTDVHQTWSFLPWHRAYLYFHERILKKLLNDNSFRLPYWEWDATAGRVLPDAYRAASVGTASNSLFNPRRSTEALSGGQIPGFYFTPNPMAAPDFPTFGGDASSGGAIENGPHGAIHMWTARNSDGLDMGRLDTAGRDPVFYAHHCNIDRLWSVWEFRNKLAHAPPTSFAFRNQTYFFYDEEKRWRSIRARDVLNPLGLEYQYGTTAALARPKEPVFTDLTLDSGTHELRLSEDAQAIASAGAGALVVKRTLVFENAIMPAKTGLYNVFAGDPPAAGADQASAPNYLGYFAILIGGHPHQRRNAVVVTPTKEFFTRAGSPGGTVITYAEAGSTQGTKLEYSNVYLADE